MLELAVAWLLTWLVHSTLVLGGVLVLTRACRGTAAEERWLKVALLASLASATWATNAGGLEPVPVTLSAAVPSLLPQLAAPESPPAARSDQYEPVPVPVTLAWPTTIALPSGAWTRVVGALWLGLAALGLLRLAGGWWALRRQLRSRCLVTAGPLAAAWAALASHRRLRLTTSPALTTPIAFGWLHPEICVPQRAATDLTPAALRAVLAHELAHLVRRDPLWNLVLRGLGCALFPQPLLVLLRRRLHDVAEARCDAAAVLATGDGLPLAQALLAVAGWLTPGKPNRWIAVASMADTQSALGRRIRSLCAGSVIAARPRIWPQALAALALASGAVLPAFGVSPWASPAAEAPVSGAATVLDQGRVIDELERLGSDLAALRAEIASLQHTADAAGEPALLRLAQTAHSITVKLDKRRLRLLARCRALVADPTVDLGEPKESR